MRLVPINVCKPGMKLGKRIYNEDGLVLLTEQMELTQRLIDRLRFNGIDFLYIADSRTDDIEIIEPLSDEVQIQALSEIRKTFRKLMEQSDRRRMVHPGEIGKNFRNIMTMIVDDVNTNTGAMIMLMNMSLSDHYLYQHSLKVCINSVLLGISYGYSREEVMELGLGALLHDIGKTQVSQKIIQKSGSLSEEEFKAIQKHTDFGFEILKNEPNIPLLSAHCAYQHHERMDGSGYPRGLKGKEIHEYAKWLGIIDSYEAMTSYRVYKDAMLPHQAMEVIFAGAGTLFDIKKIELFRDKVAIYPLGIMVRLSNRESGVVVDLNSAYPHRPIIRIFIDAEGQEMKIPYEIDLSKKLNLLIVEVNGSEVEQKLTNQHINFR